MKVAIVLVASAATMIFTFGHSFVRMENGSVMCGNPNAKQYKCSDADSFVASTFNAIAWPLYWSVQVQR